MLSPNIKVSNQGLKNIFREIAIQRDRYQIDREIARQKIKLTSIRIEFNMNLEMCVW